jgi:multiple sugar transport system substrate-binding protein
LIEDLKLRPKALLPRRILSMNRVARLLITVFLCLSLAGCSSVKNVKVPSPSPSPTPTPQESTNSFDEPEDNSAESSQDNGEKNSGTEGENVITVYCDNGEIVKFIKKFQELYPDFGYEIEIYTEYGFGDENPDRVHDLVNGRWGVIPDIYSVAREDIYKFTKGSDHKFAVPFEELGPDVDKLVKEAEIAQYMIDACTNPEGKLVALGYQSTAGAFIYRRSIAKKVWGTDDPSVISGKIGPGWDKFMKAAAELKAKGYSICSGVLDIWKPIEMSSEQGWFRDGQLVIDPAREEFLDIARKMVENGYTNNTIGWNDGWYADMKGEGEREVFGFFGPFWLVKYVIADNSGKTYGDWAVCDPTEGFFWEGTIILAHRNARHKEAVGKIIRWLTLDTSETGGQYLWANGEISGSIEIPSSATVAKKLEYKYDFLGGQDLFEAYLSAAQCARGNSLSEYDSTISLYWQEMAVEYAQGLKTREQAIADFKERVDQRLDYYAEREAYWNKPEETGKDD